MIIADINKDLVRAINKSEFESSEPRVAELIRGCVGSNLLYATSDISEAVEASEVIYIIVPTPSLKDGSFSMTHIADALVSMTPGLRWNKHSSPLVVIVSTVNPGNTKELQKITTEAIGHKVMFTYSPEFVALGSVIKDFAEPDVLLIGADDPEAGKKALDAYKGVVNPGSIHVMTTASAEIAKIGLNAALVTKTAVANQLMWLCHNIPGADARDVLKSVGADSRIGHKFFAPGLRPGGPCLPRDKRALMAVSSRVGNPIDIAHATYIYSNVQDKLLREVVGKHSTGKILVVGLTYKSGVPIEEESPGYVLFARLAHRNDVRAHDELTSCDPPLDEHIDWADTVVITTMRPPEMDLTGKVVIDCWGKYEGDCDKHIILGVGQ